MPSLYERWSKRIAQRHGRKRGWLKHHWFVALDRFGAYREYTNIHWDRVTRLVFVCSGNICRSPYSEARARALGLPACSFGLDTHGDDPAHETAIEIARRCGLDLSRFRSTAFQADRIKSGDLLLAMEPDQAKRLKKMLGSGPQITLLGLWHPQAQPYIHDPYSACREYFEACFIILDESIRRITDHFTAAHGQSTQSSSLAE